MRQRRLFALAVAVSWLAGAPAAQQTRVFRSGVDLVAVDVQVVDRVGRPVTSLTAADFEVFVDGRRRQVASATLLEYGTSSRIERPVPPPVDAPPPVVRASDPASRRLYLLAVDETSFLVSNALPALQSARRFLDNLLPGDLVALYAYPVGGQQTDFTTDHGLVRSRLDKVIGVRDRRFGAFKITASEIVDIAANDGQVLQAVILRECGPRPPSGCPEQVRAEARAAAGYYEGVAAQSLDGLRAALEALAPIEGRKTIVVLSGGMIQSDRGHRPDNRALMQRVGEWAASANTSFYVLHFDTSFFDAFDAASGGPVNPSSLSRDANVLAAGLERVVDAAGGGLIRIQAGTADFAFDRVLRETSAYYLLGVTVDDADRDGDSHFLRVTLKQGRGLTLRHRKQVVIPKGVVRVRPPSARSRPALPIH
jgi:VWFA-related protein